MATRIEATDTTARVLPPRANPDLVGHDAVECELAGLYRAGRLPHALLLAGPRGIGKATLVFRFARFLLAQNAATGRSGDVSGSASEGPLALDRDSGIFRRVASGGHADLLTIERAWDPRRGRQRGEIVAEDAREIAAFFRLTAAEGGWRIVVIDGAEEMNRSAANAVLKILEEPPQGALLLLVSHNPGRLLPTIRSRCRRLTLSPLPPRLVQELLLHHRPMLKAGEAEALAALGEGSVGRSLELADAGGLDLYRSLIELLAQVPEVALGPLYALADRLARADAEPAYRASGELLSAFLARLAADAARGSPQREEIVAGEQQAIERLAARADPAHWADLQHEVEHGFVAARELNLDRKQTLLGAFFAIEAIAR